jgi:exodeoxyribonuclease X
MRFFICDTETTGLIEPEACEIAWIEVTPELEVISEFHTLVRPPKSICCSAAGLHGIRDEDVMDSVRITEIDFPVGELCMIGHNVKFDVQILAPYLNIVSTCDTLVLARRMLANAPDHKLGTLSCYCELQRQISHRAIYDCRTVLGLLDYLIEGSGYSLLDLIDYSNKPVKVDVMPWGRHKGLKLSELPVSYKLWLKGLDDLDMDLRHSL